jgi:hypothetical protein
MTMMFSHVCTHETASVQVQRMLLADETTRPILTATANRRDTTSTKGRITTGIPRNQPGHSETSTIRHPQIRIVARPGMTMRRRRMYGLLAPQPVAMHRLVVIGPIHMIIRILPNLLILHLPLKTRGPPRLPTNLDIQVMTTGLRRTLEGVVMTNTVNLTTERDTAGIGMISATRAGTPGRGPRIDSLTLRNGSGRIVAERLGTLGTLETLGILGMLAKTVLGNLPPRGNQDNDVEGTATLVASVIKTVVVITAITPQPAILEATN